MKKSANSDPLSALLAIGEQTQDKRFSAQTAGLQNFLAKKDWKSASIACRQLYRIAQDGGFLEQVEPVLRPLFDSIVEQFEKSRAAMVRIFARLHTAARRAKQLERLASVLRVS